ncbi:Multidrug resistance protein ABC transporter [Phytophthora megakarya]|uniref:Multidrug resistance protein ABC transporter n=1 Tax=Phytophthora megakarya TaxID=4795 RepID=A0A225VUQ3_9STRA|nr:Multidrug resistance protein ABC transporter [Phytophthora megakarya]
MADMMKFTADGVPKNWKGKDWQAYKSAMQMVFREMDLMDIVGGTITRSMLSCAENEDFDRKQTKITRLIGMSVPSEILHQIRDKTTGTPTKVRELIRAASARQSELRGKSAGGQRGGQKGGANSGERSGNKSKNDNQPDAKEEKTSESKKKKKVKKCFICDSPEHLKPDCPEKFNNSSGTGGKDEPKRPPRGNMTIRQHASQMLVIHQVKLVKSKTLEW